MARRREELVHQRSNGITLGVWRDWHRGLPYVNKTIGVRHDVPDHWIASEEPTAWNYWQREALVYRSDLPRRLGLGAPEVLDIVGSERKGIELKLEDVAGRTGGALTLDDLGAAAEALGWSQGAPQPRAVDAWLSRDVLCAYPRSKPFRRSLLDDDALWAVPVVAEHLGALRPDLCRMTAELEQWCAVAARFPQAVAHLDASIRNVIRRPTGDVVFIDWALTGVGALGEDPSNLLLDAGLDAAWPIDRLAELDETVHRRYLAGLRAVGWPGDERVVRLAMCAAAVRYEWLAPALLEHATHLADPAYGPPVDVDRLFAARGSVLRVAIALVAEARRLVDDR